MSDYYLKNLRILVAKVETTPGTMETLTSSDFDVRVRNPEVSPTIEVDDEASKYANGHHGEDEVVMGAQSAQITFNIRMTCASSVTSTPKWWKFAQGCGLEPVAWGAAGYGLYPRKAYDEKTLTIWVYDIQRGATPSAICYKMAGCMGNMTIGAEGVGKPWMASFTFTGKLNDIDMNIANGDILELLSPDTTCSDKMLNNTLMVGTTSINTSSFQLDLGNEIQPQINQADDTGYDYFAITSRKPRLTINPLMQANRDVWGDLTSGLTGCPGTYELMLGDTGLNNKYTLRVPKAQIISAGIADREGLVNWDQSWKCLTNGTTGALADSDLTTEDTFELLQGSRS